MYDKSLATRWLTDVPARLRSIKPSTSLWFRSALAMCVLIIAEILLGGIDLHSFKTAGQFFLVFLYLVFLATQTRGRMREGLVAASSVMLGLSMLDALAVKSQTTSFPVVGKGFYATLPEIGWGASGPGTYPARKANPQTGATIYDVSYAITDLRLRKTDSAPSGTTIAFFGDSFTFGEGVNDSETTPQAFADLTGRRLRVLNAGFPGYGPNQVLRALQVGSFDEALGNQVRLIVLTTAPWHAERTACKPTFTLRSPRYRIGTHNVEHVGACSQGVMLAFREWIQNTSLYRSTIEPYRQKINHEDVELYIGVVDGIVELAKKKYGAETIISYLPVGDDYLRMSKFTDTEIIDRFRSSGAFVVDASLSKERAEGALIEIPGDGHPTAFAHAARAKSIMNYIAEAMPELLRE
jgi:hypothetical protein